MTKRKKTESFKDPRTLFDVLHGTSEEHVQAIISMLGGSLAMKFGSLRDTYTDNELGESYMIDESDAGGLEVEVRIRWMKKNKQGRFI